MSRLLEEVAFLSDAVTPKRVKITTDLVSEPILLKYYRFRSGREKRREGKFLVSLIQ